MNIKQALSIPVLCAGLVLSGQALAEQMIYNGSEGDLRDYPKITSSDKTPYQVQKELERFKSNPISDDGQYRYVGGDVGWVPVKHELALKAGEWKHVDTLDHITPAPAWEMTPEEQKQRAALYTPG
jgi:hypothetical protein